MNANDYSTVSNTVTNTLQSLPFGTLIGAPLSACIDAQEQMANATVDYIQRVGMNTTEDGQKEAIYVSFSFISGGRRVNFNVPMLTIVPIPYIAINTVDINFKAVVTGASNSNDTDTRSSEFNTNSKKDTKKGGGWLTKKTTTSLTTSYSSKKDSSSTRDSSFSVEATIDVAIHASQESIPAGMLKILEMLGTAIDMCSPYGELSVNDTVFYVATNGKATVIAQYKTPGGLYDSSGVKCKKEDESNTVIPGTENKKEGTKTFELMIGKHTITANDANAITIEVKTA